MVTQPQGGAVHVTWNECSGTLEFRVTKWGQLSGWWYRSGFESKLPALQP